MTLPHPSAVLCVLCKNVKEKNFQLETEEGNPFSGEKPPAVSGGRHEGSFLGCHPPRGGEEMEGGGKVAKNKDFMEVPSSLCVTLEEASFSLFSKLFLLPSD